MKKNEIIAYVYDFIHLMMDKSSIHEKINDIILFGSVARGDFTDESDVDIFINTEHQKEIEKSIREVLREFEIVSKHSWSLRKIDYPIKCVVGNIDSESWTSLKREIISSGIVLYSTYKEHPSGINHYSLITVNISKLAPKKKVKFVRKLYGYRIKKKKKVYSIKGMLDDVGGEKINPSTIIVPIKNHMKIQQFLIEWKVGSHVREIWM